MHCAGLGGSLVFPFLGILLKWIVMGRAKAGSYDLWGGYYLRRQLTQQLLRVRCCSWWQGHVLLHHSQLTRPYQCNPQRHPSRLSSWAQCALTAHLGERSSCMHSLLRVRCCLFSDSPWLWPCPASAAHPQPLIPEKLAC